MNTNHLKKFAQEARRKLLEQIGAKLNFVLTTDSAELREKTEQLKQLRQELSRTSKEQLIEKVAYTWFNRLMALRFMDVNDYQPLGIRIITPKDGYSIPEILDEAKRGNIPDELKVNRQRIYDLLDNKIPSSNPQNEAYKELLIAACNHLNSTFPFLFERINDYSEILLPDDLTSIFSIVKDVQDGMQIEDCKNVEIIGWLYQFYISEENERLIKGKKTYEKHELAPASQLFTPKWIVQYMVDNTLGQLLTELFPKTKITSKLDFYIKPSYLDQLPIRDKKRIEEIKFFDPCVGSAHILAYAFDVFYLIYKEQGYNEVEIPELIIKNNLYGTDIDERATQLSSFVLMMKGRQYYRRLLNREIIPNIDCFKDFEFDNKFNNASTIGSLLNVETSDLERIVVEGGSIFSEQQEKLKRLYRLLGQRYDIVVTNPPYISSSRMEGALKQYVERYFPDTKSDLFATFILKCLDFCDDNGITGYMSPFVWMFISSYENLRRIIISKHFINNLIQLEYSGFDGATVPICTFTLRKKYMSDVLGTYIRLTNFKGAKAQAPNALKAIGNPNCGWLYQANQSNFTKIPNSPIGYWVSNKEFELYDKGELLSSYAHPAKGIDTGENDYFLRLWHETNFKEIDLENAKAKWIPYNKGGEFRRWYGNREYILKWGYTGEELTERLKLPRKKPTLRNKDHWFKEGFTWTTVSSGGFSARYCERGALFDNGGCTLFTSENLKLLGALLNSKVADRYFEFLSPTLNFQPGGTGSIAIHAQIFTIKDIIEQLSKQCIDISRSDWNIRETAWEFQQNELLYDKGNDIEDSYRLFTQRWKNKFFKVHSLEEKINHQFIEAYGLQEELKHNVQLEKITILQDELDRKLLTKSNKELERNPTSLQVENYHELILPFVASEVMEQFISYSVGCFFGRYSLDRKGLILANTGEQEREFLQKIGKQKGECTFFPDTDNIIPILDEEWFEDDIVGRFYQFLKVTYGEKNFNRNLAFIEEQIGKDIRKYFIKDFYPDHIKRFKKRPIYWMFSSPKGSFNVLIYMHRYTPDTVSNILNKYLKEFIGKLNTRKEHLERVKETGSPSEKSKAIKESDNIQKMLVELHEYERDILYPLATERIEIDLDDGVLVNYNKFGKAVKEVNGLNDPATKKKVKQFDWIDTTQIR